MTAEDFIEYHETVTRVNEHTKQTGGLASNMTLRDKFAGQALASVEDGTTFKDDKGCAKWCYEMADAMLEARKVTE